MTNCFVNRKKSRIFVITINYILCCIMKKEKNISDIGIEVIGVREIRDGGMSAFFNSTDEGIKIVSVYGKPRCMVMSLSLAGAKKALKQMEELFGIGKQDEVSESMLYLLNDMKKIMDKIEE